MKKIWVCLMLCGLFCIPSMSLGLEQDERLSVDHGHYVGRGSVPGAHAEEATAQETGFTLHQGISFYQNGLNEGSLQTQATLYGYDVYRIRFSPTFHNAVSIRFVYDKQSGKGWLTLHMQSGAAGYYYQGGINQFSNVQTVVFQEEEAKEWHDFCNIKFPKIRTENLENSGLDGATVQAEYIIDGKYQTFQMWCPNKEMAPTFIDVIQKMVKPFEEDLEFLQSYLY